jgi:hypothetical protein
MPVSTLFLGTQEGYNDVGNVGYNDPFPSVYLVQQAYRNLVETRMAALANVPRIQDVGVPTWNDVVLGYRNVYGSQALGNLPRNLLAAFSPSGQFGYGNRNTYGSASAANSTDVTGKTVTYGAAVLTPVGLLGNATASSVVTINTGTGTTKGIVVVGITGPGDPADYTDYVYAMRTDVNNWIRVYRQSATNVRFESNVATTVATIADYTVATTEQNGGSAAAIRINTDNTYSVYYNGVRLGTGTLAVPVQGLTGTLVGMAADTPAADVVWEFEAWSTAPPYQTK